MFAWGGSRVRVTKEVPGLGAFPVGAGGGDDVEGGGVGGGTEVCDVGMRGEGPLASDFTQDQKSPPLRHLWYVFDTKPIVFVGW